MLKHSSSRGRVVERDVGPKRRVVEGKLPPVTADLSDAPYPISPIAFGLWVQFIICNTLLEDLQ